MTTKAWQLNVKLLDSQKNLIGKLDDFFIDLHRQTCGGYLVESNIRLADKNYFIDIDLPYMPIRLSVLLDGVKQEDGIHSKGVCVEFTNIDEILHDQEVMHKLLRAFTCHTA